MNEYIESAMKNVKLFPVNCINLPSFCLSHWFESNPSLPTLEGPVKVLSAWIYVFCFSSSIFQIPRTSSEHSFQRLWSRTSRRRRSVTSLTDPYLASRTTWPTPQSEAMFLPEYEVCPKSAERDYKVCQTKLFRSLLYIKFTPRLR